MFRPTDSIITAGDRKNQRLNRVQKEKRNNILNILDKDQESDDVDDIETFEQFMNAVNSFDFMKNEQMNNRSNKNQQSKMLKPKFSLGAEPIRQKRKNQIYMTQNSNVFESLGVPGSHSLEPPGGYLNIVREQLYSRGSTKKAMVQRKQNYQSGLDLAYKANDHEQQRNQSRFKRIQTNQNNNSVYKSSAHSSRSFNGFQQINQYQVKQTIGSGAFSSVNLCIDIHTQQKYAMKTLMRKHFQKKLFRKNSVALADNYINNQIALLKKMQHPYIIRLFEVIEDEIKDKIYLILEYCSGGFINQAKKSETLMLSGNMLYRRLLQSQCKRYFKQISLAIDYLHNVVKIAHRDIKPQNILLSEKDEAKISDFGLGTQDIEVHSKSGTKGYLPPEARNSEVSPSNIKITTQMADIWALGITLLVMLQGKFIELDDNKLLMYVSGLKDISVECKDFLQQCLKIDPSQRITAAQMLDHPWIMAKKMGNYPEIQISKQDYEKAVVQRNRDILKQITRLHLT